MKWSNYRALSNGQYADNADVLDLNGNGTIESSEATSVKVWRKSKEYSWWGENTRLNADGTHAFAAADRFSFSTGAENLLWKNTGTFRRFDHYSHLLETSDFSDVFNAEKYGYVNLYKIVTSSSARFEEGCLYVVLKTV